MGTQFLHRARESFASAEVEVLSSTSKDVSERYNGNEIIRKEGQTETKECHASK
jgi:hypothetical protein